MKLYLITCILAISASNNMLAQRAISDDLYKKYYSYQPPKKKFKFENKISDYNNQKDNTHSLDTNVIYLVTYFDSIKNDTFFSYSRFFGNGIFFVSDEYLSFPSEKEINDLSYGSYGFYIIKENELIIETYVHGFPSQFWYTYGRFQDDGIYFYKQTIGKCSPKSFDVNRKAVKTVISPQNFEIIWD